MTGQRRVKNTPRHSREAETIPPIKRGAAPPDRLLTERTDATWYRDDGGTETASYAAEAESQARRIAPLQVDETLIR